MGLERLLICPCGHDIAQHDASGCHAASCDCRLPRNLVVENVLNEERDEMRQRWFSDDQPKQ